jgi:hypothetical protein
MKSVRYALITLLALLTLSAAAQRVQHPGTWFKVPFSFTVGEQTLPAGDYLVEGLAWNAVAFHPADGKSGLIVLAQSAPRTQEITAKLVFHRYGDHYYLASAELPNMDYARAFPTAKSESRIAKSQPHQEKVEIAGK